MRLSAGFLLGCGAVLCLASESAVAAGTTPIPGAEVILTVLARTYPDQVPEAAPPRFVLMHDRQVFVGGTSEILTAHLQKRDLKQVEAAVKRVRKRKDLAGELSFGPGDAVYRLWLKDGSREIVARGDPTRAEGALRDLARLVDVLGDFDHPALRRYAPQAYALRAREQTLAGGCRSWGFVVALRDALKSAWPVPPSAVRGWPTGANPASVCAEGRRYVVTLRPLLPGERP